MSLILEALKKSEQQRRLGEVPTLGTPVHIVRRRRSVLPVLLVLIVVGAGAAWWLTQRPLAPATAPPVAAAPDAAKLAAVDVDQPQTADSTAPTAVPGVAPVAPKADFGPLPRKPRTHPAQTGTNAAPPPARGAFPRPEDVPTDVPGPATAPAAKPVAKAPATPVPATPAPSAAAPAASAATPSAAPVAKAPIAAPTAATVPATQAAGPSYPLVWTLPYATRKDLPDLRLTMHVYSDVPADRFVILDGERHAEGDTISDGLTLRQIRRDGLVLDYKGTVFLYPRDGR